jgi:hypothetical protein
MTFLSTVKNAAINPDHAQTLEKQLGFCHQVSKTPCHPTGKKILVVHWPNFKK